MGDARPGARAPPEPAVEFQERSAPSAPGATASASPTAPTLVPPARPPHARPAAGAPSAAWRQAVMSPRRTTREGSPIDTLATNAPAHWPRVQAPRTFLARRGPGYADRFHAGIRRSFEDHGFAVSEPEPQLLDSGVLDIPFAVHERGAQVPVFPYPRGDAKAAAHFAGVRKLMAALGSPPPVYYAPQALRQVPATNPCGGLRLEHLEVVDERPTGRFAMWWATPGDTDYVASAAGQSIRRAFQALDGREAYVYARLLRALGGPDVGLARANLPPEEQRFSASVKGPDGEVLYVTASAERGVRFHFDKDNTPSQYRDRFWRHFADYAEATARELSAGGAYKDAYYEDRPLRWLEGLERKLRVATAGVGEDDRLVGAHIVTGRGA